MKQTKEMVYGEHYLTIEESYKRVEDFNRNFMQLARDMKISGRTLCTSGSVKQYKHLSLRINKGKADRLDIYVRLISVVYAKAVRLDACDDKEPLQRLNAIIQELFYGSPISSTISAT